jgi:hypothetical protein
VKEVMHMMPLALVRRLCGGVALVVGTAMLVGTGPSLVPVAMRGTWAHGSCSNPKARLVITARTIASGGGKALPVMYVPDDGPNGEGAIHFREEGVVSNFVLEPLGIVENTEGYGMPGRMLFRRCRAAAK